MTGAREASGSLPGAADELRRSVTLRDGRSVEIRELRRDDEAALHDFLAGLSLESRRLRFFTGGIDVDRITPAVASTEDRIGVVAVEPAGTLVGHAMCSPTHAGRGEVAIEIADRLHGQGLGTILLERLAELAEARGIEVLVAQVLPDNREMLDVFRDGFDAHVRWQEGIDYVEFASGAWRLAEERFPQAAGGAA